MLFVKRTFLQSASIVKTIVCTNPPPHPCSSQDILTARLPTPIILVCNQQCDSDYFALNCPKWSIEIESWFMHALLNRYWRRLHFQFRYLPVAPHTLPLNLDLQYNHTFPVLMLLLCFTTMSSCKASPTFFRWDRVLNNILVRGTSRFDFEQLAISN